MKKILCFCGFIFLSFVAFSQWTQQSGNGLGKTIYNDNVKAWLIGMDDGIYLFNGSYWVQYPGNGKGKDIAACNGVPYIIGMDNAIYIGK